MFDHQTDCLQQRRQIGAGLGQDRFDLGGELRGPVLGSEDNGGNRRARGVDKRRDQIFAETVRKLEVKDDELELFAGEKLAS